MSELRAGLAEYFTFYNGERPHQSLDYKKHLMLCIEPQQEEGH